MSFPAVVSVEKLTLQGMNLHLLTVGYTGVYLPIWPTLGRAQSRHVPDGPVPGGPASLGYV